MSSRAAVPREDTSRLVGGPSGVRKQLTPGAPGKKGTAEPAPLGAVVGEHWRARSVLGTLPDGQKTGLWRTLNQVGSAAAVSCGVRCVGVRLRARLPPCCAPPRPAPPGWIRGV